MPCGNFANANVPVFPSTTEFTMVPRAKFSHLTVASMPIDLVLASTTTPPMVTNESVGVGDGFSLGVMDGDGTGKVLGMPDGLEVGVVEGAGAGFAEG